MQGGPGSRKGTVCKYIKERHQTVDSISLGEQLRQEVQDPQSSFRDFIIENFSRGIAVPATVEIKIFRKRLEKSAREGRTTVILDRFPRSTKKLQSFERETSAQYETVYLDCAPELLAHRLGTRAESGRADDEDETIRLRRAANYNQEASEVIKSLRERPFHEVHSPSS
ncbi:adenylate kinase-domain-containing protein [Microdochium bolleyi]|uniref:Adenylate kinase-domain-containing protein n=1 Tax=Microdochium bolleyi TaxID=196109 RepID=A0A136IIZ7_9PEZI|nr:adenylate kinase-domain-containing protein [Microdochium bolleyi]